MTQPELAENVPGHLDAIACEARHCADQLVRLAELMGGAHSSDEARRYLNAAANAARMGADQIEGSHQ